MANALLFRAAFRPIFLALCAVPLPVVVLALFIGSGRRIMQVVEQAITVGLGPKIALLGLLFGGLLVAAVAFAALTLSQRLLVHLRQTGIAARTAWGRTVFVAWEDIEQVRRVSYPFVTFLRVMAAGKPAILVPLFVTDPSGLRRGLQLMAPDGNPLRTELLSRPRDDSSA